MTDNTEEPEKLLSLRFAGDTDALSVTAYNDGSVLIKEHGECVIATLRQLETIVAAVRNCVNPA